MSDEVASAETGWQQAKSTYGEDHPETRNLRGILDAAKQRQANAEYLDSLQRQEEQSIAYANSTPNGLGISCTFRSTCFT